MLHALTRKEWPVFTGWAGGSSGWETMQSRSSWQVDTQWVNISNKGIPEKTAELDQYLLVLCMFWAL